MNQTINKKMNSNLFFGSMLALAAASCANATEPANCTLSVNLSPDEDGIYVYLTDYDSGVKVDSALVDNGMAKFEEHVDTPYYARLLIEGQRLGDIFIEPAQISVNPTEHKIESNGKLYSSLENMQKDLGAIVSEFRALPDDSTSTERAEALGKRYDTILVSTMNANIDNALGYLLFISAIQSYDLGELDEALVKYPHFKKSQRVSRSREHLIVKDETSVGHKYKDFAITNDGKTQRLCDFLGSDHYTLVDFWASWCGPCIRELSVIKKLYEKYNGKGLNVLGVAVWDEPQNTVKAIEEHQIPWDVIINAQTIPTDLYGISGIPCIILIAPDGTIVSRDQQDENLVRDVEAAMAEFNKTTE